MDDGVSRGAGRLGQPQTGLNWAPEACPHFLGARLIVERRPSSRDLDAKPVKMRRRVVHPPQGRGWGVRPPPPWPPAHRPREGSLPCPRWPRGSGGAHAAPVPSPRCAGWSCLGKRDSGAEGRQESGKASWGRCCVPWALAAGLQGEGWQVGEVEVRALQTPEPPEGVGSGPLLSRGDRTSDGPRVQLFFCPEEYVFLKESSVIHQHLRAGLFTDVWEALGRLVVASWRADPWKARRCRAGARRGRAPWRKCVCRADLADSRPGLEFGPSTGATCGGGSGRGVAGPSYP